MNEAKQLTKERSRILKRKNSLSVELAVWVLVAVEVVRVALPYVKDYLSW